MKTFANPVVAEDGHTYERAELAAFVARHGRFSPVTGEPLDGSAGPPPNLALLAAMASARRGRAPATSPSAARAAGRRAARALSDAAGGARRGAAAVAAAVAAGVATVAPAGTAAGGSVELAARGAGGRDGVVVDQRKRRWYARESADGRRRLVGGRVVDEPVVGGGVGVAGARRGARAASGRRRRRGEPISEDGVDVRWAVPTAAAAGVASRMDGGAPGPGAQARPEIHQMRMSAWREALAAHEQEVSITRIFGH